MPPSCTDQPDENAASRESENAPPRLAGALRGHWRAAGRVDRGAARGGVCGAALGGDGAHVGGDRGVSLHESRERPQSRAGVVRWTLACSRSPDARRCSGHAGRPHSRGGNRLAGDAGEPGGTEAWGIARENRGAVRAVADARRAPPTTRRGAAQRGDPRRRAPAVSVGEERRRLSRVGETSRHAADGDRALHRGLAMAAGRRAPAAGGREPRATHRAFAKCDRGITRDVATLARARALGASRYAVRQPGCG